MDESKYMSLQPRIDQVCHYYLHEDMIDPAMLRPGRLDKALYVDFPSGPERVEILKTLTRASPLDASIDLSVIGNMEECDGFSGADLASLVREAGVSALRRQVYGTADDAGARDMMRVSVCMEDYVSAFARIAPSVGKKDRKRYELLKVRFG
jgi:ribosome biogenesis ATPase